MESARWVSAAQVVDAERRYTVQCYGSRRAQPVVASAGVGAELWDVDGRRYLDFTAQAASCVLGFQHPAIIGALRAQLDFAVASPNIIHPRRVELAERLVALTDSQLTRCYFGVSGSDAVEAALKFARKATGRWKFVSLWNGYHGSTFGALSAHGIATARHPYEPLVPGFAHASPPDCRHCDLGLVYPQCQLACVDLLERIILREGPEHVAAVIVEPILAGGGVIVPPDDFLPRLRRICDRFGVLLILDEIVTGFGRTGTMFAYQRHGIIPDMLVLGKGLTSGYQAASAVLVRESIDPFKPSPADEPVHMHTLSGSPLASAAALAVIDTIVRDGLVERAASLGERLNQALVDRLRDLPRIRDVRGRGLLIGIELDPKREDPKALERAVVAACRDRGLLVQGSSGPYAVAVLHPPLVVTDAQIGEAEAVLTDVVRTLD
jgi:4-aminobutyrate aminotransferase-like enzyme